MTFLKEQYNSLSPSLLDAYNQAQGREKDSHICYAPFGTMRFTLSGHVVACCYNKQYPLGKYPENSIHDIWFGSKISRLKDHLTNNSLSLGCQSCKSNLLSGSFNSVGAKHYDYLSPATNTYPKMLEFELANTCNLECIMCSGALSSSIRRNREHKPAYPSLYDQAFTDQLDEFIPHLKDAVFVGGEPFLIDLYYDIWERMILINSDINISVVTNGSILNNKVKTLLEKGNFSFRISIDSLQKDNYNQIRVNADFDVVMANFNYFLKYSTKRNTAININVCPMRQNWKEMPDYIRFGNKQNVSINMMTVKFPPHTSLWNLSTVELQEAISYLSEFSFPEESLVEKQNAHAYKTLIQQLKQWMLEAENKASTNLNTAIDLSGQKRIFYARIEQFVNNDNSITNKLEKQKMLNHYRQTVETVFRGLEGDELLWKSLVNINQLQIETIVEVMTVNSIDSLIERFKQAAQI